MSKGAVPKLFEAKEGPYHTVLNWHNDAPGELRFYARSFHKAARTLIENWELDRGHAPSDWDACPVVFLYRHALELYLKSVLLGAGRNFQASPPAPEWV